QVATRVVPVAGETVDHAAHGGCALGLKNGGRLDVRLAHVHDERPARGSRERDGAGEGGALGRTRPAVVVEVETGLADADDAGAQCRAGSPRGVGGRQGRAASRSAVAGRKGAGSCAAVRSASQSSWRIAPTRGSRTGSLASVNGAVSTTYLLAWSSARHTASSPRWKARSAMCASSSRAAAAKAARKAWSGASGASGCTTPPK